MSELTLDLSDRDIDRIAEATAARLAHLLPKPAKPAMWTTKEMASHLNCTEQTVRRKVNAGEIECQRIGNEMRFEPR